MKTPLPLRILFPGGLLLKPGRKVICMCILGFMGAAIPVKAQLRIQANFEQAQNEKVSVAFNSSSGNYKNNYDKDLLTDHKVDGIVTDEIDIQQSSSNIFDVNFENILYKGNNPPPNFTNSIQNQEPGFITIDTYNNIYDFHLQGISPCINSGKNSTVSIDLDGNTRDANPDIGCYEYHP